MIGSFVQGILYITFKVDAYVTWEFIGERRVGSWLGSALKATETTIANALKCNL